MSSYAFNKWILLSWMCQLYPPFAIFGFLKYYSSTKEHSTALRIKDLVSFNRIASLCMLYILLHISAVKPFSSKQLDNFELFAWGCLES